MNNDRTRRVPLTGYSNRLSARAGDTINFKLSADNHDAKDPASVRSWLTHSICADPNPSGPGIIERDASQWYDGGEHKVWQQPINAGSCALSSAVTCPAELSDIQISATVWPTLVNNTRQCIMKFGALVLCINENNAFEVSLDEHLVSFVLPVRERQWTSITTRVQRQGADVVLSLLCREISDAVTKDFQRKQATTTATTNVPAAVLDGFKKASFHLSIAAQHAHDAMTCHFNGKVEAPELLITGSTSESHTKESKRIAWDFGKDMSQRCIEDIEGHAISLELFNLPARAMKSSAWTGAEMCWRHAPEQYAAIHFHDDDLVDVQWDTSFTYTLPADIPSGVYIMRISDGQHEDAMPFFCLCPEKPTCTQAVCSGLDIYLCHLWQSRTSRLGPGLADSGKGLECLSQQPGTISGIWTIDLQLS